MGNAIGQRNISEAKKYSKLSLIIAALWSAFTVVTLYGFRRDFISLFSADSSVNEIIKIGFKGLVISLSINSLTQVCMGIICGLGKQKIATRVTIVGQYILGIPFAFIWVLKYNAGFAGLWYG